MMKDKWILEAYEAADEQGRLDMYMTCRDQREEFDRIDADQVDRKEEKRKGADPLSMRGRWGFCGRLLRAFGV